MRTLNLNTNTDFHLPGEVKDYLKKIDYKPYMTVCYPLETITLVIKGNDLVSFADTRLQNRQEGCKLTNKLRKAGENGYDFVMFRNDKEMLGLYSVRNN